jgi:hypothetical protein
MRKLYEWIDSSGDGVVSGWKLQERQSAKLDSKLPLLCRAEVSPGGKVDLPPGLIGGPGIDGQSWIYELKIHGNVALRPMLCLGPISRDREWTILARAVEKDRVLKPSNAAAMAEARRQDIIKNPDNRRLLWEEEDEPTN